MIFQTLHSSATGLSATRGAWTNFEGAGVRPDNANSSTPRFTGADVMFTASRSSHVAREHVNSPACSMLETESLRPCDENMTIGGLWLTTLKKLYGARLSEPSGPTHEIHPIGRGAIRALNGLKRKPWSFAAGS